MIAKKSIVKRNSEPFLDEIIQKSEDSIDLRKKDSSEKYDGIFIYHYIGVHGIPKKEINDVILKFKENTNYDDIRHHFKFIKEFYIPDTTTENSDIEIKSL